MSRQEEKPSPQEAAPEVEASYLDDLPVEGWFWELVRRDETYRKRFRQIEEAAREYLASRLDTDVYRGRLKSYFSHMWRYGIRPTAPSARAALVKRLKPDCYLFLPVPGEDRVIAVPRPEVKYPDFGPAKPALRGLSVRRPWSRINKQRSSESEEVCRARERIAAIMQVLKDG